MIFYHISLLDWFRTEFMNLGHLSARLVQDRVYDLLSYLSANWFRIELSTLVQLF